MAKMRGVVLVEQGDGKHPGKMQYREDLEVPTPSGRMVRIRTAYTGVCGSDVSYVYGKASVDKGRVLGHETGGIVDAVGPEVSTLRPGQRVVVDPVQSNPDSPWVKRGMGNVDLSSVTGISYDGGFGEYYLSHESYTYPIPDDMTFQQAAGLEPFACGLYAVNNANVVPNEMVVIFGAGPIANSMCEMAKAKGARTVVLIGTRDYRLEAARGADVRLNVGTSQDTKYPCRNAADAIRKLNDGELPRSVIVATGSASAIEQGWELGGRRSTVVSFGLMADNTTFTHKCQPALFLDKTLRFSWLAPNTWPEVMALVKNGLVRVEDMHSHRTNLKGLENAIQTQAERRDNCIKYLIEVGGNLS
jgi:L-iditol 2-dehydrogenase